MHGNAGFYPQPIPGEEQTMAETKSGHTPGPWSYEKSHPNAGSYATIRGADGEALCHIGLVMPADEHDARLIAASPTMYEYVRRKADEGDRYAAAIIAAIG